MHALGRELCAELELLSGRVARYSARTGLLIFVRGRWVSGSGVTREERGPLREVPVRRRRRERRRGEKMRAPAGRLGGSLLHQQVMHELRCLQWFRGAGVTPNCKCAAHSPFPDGYVLPALPGGPGASCARELRRLLGERGLFYVTGEVGVVVDPDARKGTFVDGVAAALENPRELWALELKTGHRHVAGLTLARHKAQTRAGMKGLARLAARLREKTTVAGGLLIYLDGVRECVRVEEIRWESGRKK